jgi:RNA polymerase sigma-70 factor (ECF subfamily)
VSKPGRGPAAAELRERSTWEQFVVSSYPAVWRFCAALAGRDAADDLAQETFMRATRALPAFRAQASGRTWILSIARRVCMDELRGRYRRDRRDREIAEVTDSSSTTADEVADGLAARDLLRELAPDRRVAFVLTQLFQLSYAETAAVCDCPVGTIRSRVARARDDLIQLLGSERSSRARHVAE